MVALKLVCIAINYYLYICSSLCYLSFPSYGLECPFFKIKIMYLRLLVSSIFLILTLTSTVANANCVVDGAGAIVTPANIRTAPTPAL